MKDITLQKLNVLHAVFNNSTIKTAKQQTKKNIISTHVCSVHFPLESFCVLAGIFFQSVCGNAFKSFPCHLSAHRF